jgi:hypothetical protein
MVGLILVVGIACGVPALLADTLVGTVKIADPADDATTSISDTPATDNENSATQKAAETPHFWQRDSRGGFANGGRDYCCPVAVSNSLVYLAHHGFPALLPEGNGDQPQIDLINLLASSDYFGTDPANGTSPGEVLSGVQKYVEDNGYRCERLEYEGWRKVGRNNQDEIKASRPSLDWIKEGIRNPHGAVWLNIGWYTQNGDGEWKRTGGHWVTLVGCGNADDANQLLIHNPGMRGSDNPANDVVHLQPVAEGTLDTGRQSTEDASGMYLISGLGLPISRGVDAAFLDAAIVLVVSR